MIDYKNDDYPKTEDEYWALTIKHQVTLQNLINRYAKQKVNLQEAIKQRDKKVEDIFNHVWMMMPDTQSTRSIEGFFLLCDLCSEAYVLHGE